MKAILQVNGLTGGYHANRPVINDVSFAVNSGEIVALIGLNGAGKSTVIKHILGFMRPFAGKVTIEGRTSDDGLENYRSRLAYVPENPMYYQELTLWEHLELTSMSYGMDKRYFTERAKMLLERFDLGKKKDDFPQFFSKGMRQKMMLIAALLAQPPLYVIDEPLTGLDPLGIRTLLQSLQQAKQEGAGILMSTHILSTAEKYCDRFILLHGGRIIMLGTLEELRKAAGQPHGSLDDLYLQFIERSSGRNGG